jgi:peptidoglycan-associated lipoprotein
MNMNMRATLALVALLAGCAKAPESQTTATTASSGATTVVPGSQEDLVASVGDRIFFDFDRSEIVGHGALTLSNAQTLDRQAAWLAKYAQNNVQIAGNCDERGTEEYNLALGQRRADATRRYLVAKGVSGARITTISYGKERPTALGSNEEAWAQNRNAITSVK